MFVMHSLSVLSFCIKGKKKTWNLSIPGFWRRERDSNPRTGISRYTISNRAPSTNSAISPYFVAWSLARSNKMYYNSFLQCVKHFEKFFQISLLLHITMRWSSAHNNI